MAPFGTARSVAPLWEWVNILPEMKWQRKNIIGIYKRYHTIKSTRNLVFFLLTSMSSRSNSLRCAECKTKFLKSYGLKSGCVQSIVGINTPSVVVGNIVANKKRIEWIFSIVRAWKMMKPQPLQASAKFTRTVWQFAVWIRVLLLSY